MVLQALRVDGGSEGGGGGGGGEGTGWLVLMYCSFVAL